MSDPPEGGGGGTSGQEGVPASLCPAPAYRPRLAHEDRGNKVTYVDFLVYDVLDQHRIFEPKCLDAFPNLKDFMGRFEGLKKISDYMKSSRFLSKPIFAKMAFWNPK